MGVCLGYYRKAQHSHKVFLVWSLGPKAFYYDSLEPLGYGGYVTIGYTEPSSHYLRSWSPRVGFQGPTLNPKPLKCLAGAVSVEPVEDYQVAASLGG